MLEKLYTRKAVIALMALILAANGLLLYQFQIKPPTETANTPSSEGNPGIPTSPPQPEDEEAVDGDEEEDEGSSAEEEGDEESSDEATEDGGGAVEEAPTGNGPVEGGGSLDEAPTDEDAPAEDAPAEDAPAEDDSSEEEAPTEEAPVETGAPTEDAPVGEEAPSDEAPVGEDTPAEDAPAEEGGAQAPPDTDGSRQEEQPGDQIIEGEASEDPDLRSAGEPSETPFESQYAAPPTSPGGG